MVRMGFVREFWNRLRIEPRRLLVYVLVYALAGTIMNEIGKTLEIARFRWWWQIVTVYLLYCLPVSLYLRRLSFWQQYLHGLFFLALLEFGGYALGSSYAYPDNLIDRYLSPRNFSLFMALAFGLIPPVGNLLVERIAQLLPGVPADEPPAERDRA